MAAESMRFRNPAGHRGLLSNLLATGNALGAFFESRLSLFGQEAKGALIQMVVLVACLAAALVLCAFAYVFLIVSVIVGVAHLLHVSWLWTALGAALLHFILAVFCLLVARSRLVKPMFRATREELKKDREWLKNPDKRNPARS
jgi:uncharacterized membrane protein YqjE